MSKTLLLIDDSVVIHRVVEIAFGSEDISVSTLTDSGEAIKKIPEIKPDVILIDISLPNMDGYDLCKEIRQTLNMPHIPLVLLVEAYEEFNPEKAKAAGTEFFLNKPFEVNSLVDLVKNLINNGGDAGVVETPVEEADFTPPPPPAEANEGALFDLPATDSEPQEPIAAAPDPIPDPPQEAAPEPPQAGEDTLFSPPPPPESLTEESAPDIQVNEVEIEPEEASAPIEEIPEPETAYATAEEAEDLPSSDNLEQYMVKDPGTLAFQEDQTMAPPQPEMTSSFNETKETNTSSLPQFEVQGTIKDEEDQDFQDRIKAEIMQNLNHVVKHEFKKSLVDSIKKEVMEDLSQIKMEIQQQIKEGLEKSLADSLGNHLKVALKEYFVEEVIRPFQTKQENKMEEIAKAQLNTQLPDLLDERVGDELKNNMEPFLSEVYQNIEIDESMVKRCLTQMSADKIQNTCNDIIPDIARIVIKEEIRRLTEDQVTL